MLNLFLYGYGDHLYLHVPTHSFPTRRSSELSDTFARSRPRARRRYPPRRSRVSPSRKMPGPSSPPLLRLTNRWRTLRFLMFRLHNLVSSDEHTSELQSLMRISYAVFCLQKKQKEKENRLISPYNFNYI